MTKKIYAYGMDGFVTPMMKYFAAEGCLPNFSRLLNEGTVNETYPSFPVWTPTNWATLSTGAHTGTHSVPTWQTVIERKSDPNDKDVSVSSFDGRANNAERIWNALEPAPVSKRLAVSLPRCPSFGRGNRLRCRRFRVSRAQQH